jgi:hypothetical protein
MVLGVPLPCTTAGYVCSIRNVTGDGTAIALMHEGFAMP